MFFESVCGPFLLPNVSLAPMTKMFQHTETAAASLSSSLTPLTLFLHELDNLQQQLTPLPKWDYIPSYWGC